ncbi:MAG: TIGR02281 family clan AA aspartic protease [Hyphomicrobium sp.]|nr:TIGR02281 family clan AA aspartic protease [Hyphomicrobium sp.]
MLVWLALIVAALSGLFVLVQNSGAEHSAMSAGLTGIGVVVFLIVLYATTHKGRWGGHSSDSRSPKALAALLFAAAAVALGVWSLATGHLLGTTFTKSDATAPDRLASGARGAVSVLIRRNSQGQFVAQGQINGVSSQLMVDTGATAVMLKHSDAEKAGIDTASLAFTTPVQTANGTVYAAPVRVRSIAIGLLRFDDIEALIARPGSLNENLLGISFLRRLASYDLNGEFLTLRQ